MFFKSLELNGEVMVFLTKIYIWNCLCQVEKPPQEGSYLTNSQEFVDLILEQTLVCQFFITNPILSFSRLIPRELVLEPPQL